MQVTIWLQYPTGYVLVLPVWNCTRKGIKAAVGNVNRLRRKKARTQGPRSSLHREPFNKKSRLVECKVDLRVRTLMADVAWLVRRGQLVQ